MQGTCRSIRRSSDCRVTRGCSHVHGPHRSQDSRYMHLIKNNAYKYTDTNSPDKHKSKHTHSCTCDAHTRWCMHRNRHPILCIQPPIPQRGAVPTGSAQGQRTAISEIAHLCTTSQLSMFTDNNHKPITEIITGQCMTFHPNTYQG